MGDAKSNKRIFCIINLQSIYTIAFLAQVGLQNAMLCAEERCIAFVARVEDGATYTIDRQTFTNPRRFRR